LPPTTVFPPITPLEGQPFFLLSAMEPWISTMETQTLSARNAVGLLARAWWGVRMGSCLAGEGVQARGEVLEDGWDWTC
jgi:prenylcysteine oxidase/farnesylcysteine lyase